MNSIPEKLEREKFGIQEFLTHQRGLLARMVMLSVVVLLSGQFAISWFALLGFETELSPQLSQKAEVVGNTISSELAFAVGELDIPPHQLVGVEDYFDNYLQINMDIEYLAMIDPNGQVLFVRGVDLATIETILNELKFQHISKANFETDVLGYLDGAFPILETLAGSTILHVGVTSEHIRSQFFEMIFEILTVIVISWLVTFELLGFYMRRRISRPINHIRTVLAEGSRGVFTTRLVGRTKDEIGQLTTSFNNLVQNLQHKYNDFLFEVAELKHAQIDNKIGNKINGVREAFDLKFTLSGIRDVDSKQVSQIRVPLFMFIFSEELSRSFIPLFVSKYAPTDLMLSHDLLISLPITLFMLAVMVVTPFGGGLVERFGVHRIFLIGVVIATVGFIGNFLTQTYYDLVAFRVLTGIGYSLIFVASEGWVVQNAGEHNRSQSTGIFVTAVFVGIICGPPIGGMIANRIGFEATFLISACLAVTSGLIIYQIFRSEGDTIENRRPRTIISAWELITLLKDPRFFSVLFLTAIPAKMMISGFIAYLVPLYLTQLGHNESSVGRLMMFYGLATLALIYVSTRYADRTRNFVQVVFAGGLLAGAGCIATLFSQQIGLSNTNAVVVAILLLGFGHALLLTSQNSIILTVASDYADTIGRTMTVSAYRVFERIGMVIGPLVAVGLISQFGYHNAIAGFGAIIFILIVMFLVIMSRPRARNFKRQATTRPQG
ncbi:MAG: MFS transporter [Acidiferrobacterales bacterium]|nr:MFS transporter [Acidiferrobacterales bacterium]